MTLADLQQTLGHQFTDVSLLERALTHASVSKKAGQDNERLEFLGDRVLGVVVADMIYRQFPGDAEGVLATRYNHLVRRESCARVAEALGLEDHLKAGIAGNAASKKAKTRLMANACEAVIGALYLDGGMDKAATLIRAQWEPLLADGAVPDLDAKTALQEWAQGQGLPIPSYKLKDRSGPDHAPHFTIKVSVDGHEPAMGEGSSKREAEQAAAAAFLESQGVGK